MKVDTEKMTISVTPSDHRFLMALKDLLLTQDNDGTADPHFVVNQQKRTWGFDGDYVGQYVWMDSDGENYCEGDDIDGLYEMLLDYETNIIETGFKSDASYRERILEEMAFQKVYYKDDDVPVDGAIFFTRASAQEYISRNSHRLNSPTIYTDSFYRNPEMIRLRGILINII